MSIYRDIALAVQSPTFDPRQLGRISMQTDGDLCVLNYNHAAQFSAPESWNAYEKVCRGLILNRKTGEIVALGMGKFWNYSEVYPDPNAKIVSITEKLDGSLGLAYRTPDGIQIATRGAFYSEQAVWATAFWQHHYAHVIVPPCATLLFECIFPGNKIIVDYGKEEALYLLAITDRYSCTEWSDGKVDCFAGAWGFPRPLYYRIDTIENVVTAAKELDANHEGWVIKYDDGTRFKVKGNQYRELHKILSDVSFVHTVEAIMGDKLDDVIAILPEEYRVQVRQWAADIEGLMAALHTRVWCDVVNVLSELLTRKEKAIWIMNNRKDYSALYFAALDGRDTRLIILRRFVDNKSANW